MSTQSQHLHPSAAPPPPPTPPPPRSCPGPIKFDFVKDRRDELNQRFQMLGQAGSDSGTTNLPQSERSGSIVAGQRKHRSKSERQSREVKMATIPVVSFNDFTEKLTQDAVAAGTDPEDLLGKDRISAKNIDKILPGWRSLTTRVDNIFEEVKTRLNVHRTLKDKYSNVKAFFNPQFDPYDDITVTEPKSRVQPKVKRQVVKGIPISEKNPQKVVTVLDELMEVFKKEELQPRST